MIAAGRKPRTTDISLETIGLKDGSVLHVDDTLCVHSVSGEWLYAVGDTNAQAPLTHMGKYSAKVAGDTIAVRANGTLTKQATATAFSPHSATAQQSAYNPTGHLHRSTGGIGRANAGSSTQGRQEGQRGHYENGWTRDVPPRRRL